MIQRKAFITGVTGQDGSYLAELLVSKGYVVHGLVYTKDSSNPAQKNQLSEQVIFHEGDLKDLASLRNALEASTPDEVYNLAGVTDLATAWEFPSETMEMNYYGVGRLVNETLRVNPKAHIFQAGSALMFDPSHTTQSETTPFFVNDPYSDAKIKAHEDFVRHYRERDGSFICTGFLFNHESPRRDTRFVTAKIAETLVKIMQGEEEVLDIGNLDAKRDWGFAGDYVEAMWMMLQQDKPNDYVIATGELHTVRDFIETAGIALSMPITWEGKELHEVGKDSNGKIIVRVDEKYYKSKTHSMVGDISRIKKDLGWKPKTSFTELVRLMVEGSVHK